MVGTNVLDGIGIQLQECNFGSSAQTENAISGEMLWTLGHELHSGNLCSAHKKWQCKKPSRNGMEYIAVNFVAAGTWRVVLCFWCQVMPKKNSSQGTHSKPFKAANSVTLRKFSFKAACERGLKRWLPKPWTLFISCFWQALKKGKCLDILKLHGMCSFS